MDICDQRILTKWPNCFDIGPKSIKSQRAKAIKKLVLFSVAKLSVCF